MVPDINPMPQIGPEVFLQVEMRVGRILEVDDVPAARKPSYRLRIDFGPFGQKLSSAALRPWYAKEELVGRLVIAVVNFPPRQVATTRSEVLVLGAVQADGRVVLLRPEAESALGARVA